MKKRIVCVLLTLIMLMSLLPISASAASMNVSESAITVLKQLQVYSSVCQNYDSEWRNGYGTICSRSGSDHANHTDTFTEMDADAALRVKMAELAQSVNTFAANTGVTLTQSQFDALVVFSYDCGTSWMSGTGVLRNAIVNGLSGSAFLNAIGQSSNFGSSTNDKVTGVQRRMIEANMYLNGAYSNVAPSNYTYVIFDANGGTMAEGTNGIYTQYIDLNLSAVPAVTPTKANHYFLGWYTSETGYSSYVWAPRLEGFRSERTMYALWQPVSATYKDAQVVDYWYIVTGNVYATPDASTTAIDYIYGTSQHITKDFLDKDGTRWSYIDGVGWIVVTNGTTTSSSNSDFAMDVTVTVTNSYVRSRKNASIYSTQNGTYYQGDQLRIVNVKDADGFQWGQVANSADTAIGWVALMYTNWNSVKEQSTTTTSNSVIAQAVINCPGYLNIRAEAGTDYAIVGALADGDNADIYEIKFVNGHKWGRTNGGWILLTYAKVTMLDNSAVDYSTSADVLAYTFTGKLINAVTAHTDAAHTADVVGSELAAGTVVAVSMVKNDNDGNIWGFNGTGWIELSKVDMDIAKYVVISDSVTVRNSASSSAGTVEKVVKGVELDIEEIKVVDATIWGFTSKYNGWVNLASKYVQRSNTPVIENAEGEETLKGLMATVINTDKLRVRSYGATYGNVIGSLTRGTTVAIWEVNEDGDWYKVDSNKNGVYDYKGDGWVSASYVDVFRETDETSSTTTSTTTGTTTSATIETGLGIVANTYAGVNVRTGAGTGNAAVGKLLPGTTVEILEVTTKGASKWGRTEKGWVCMDYITMVSNYAIGNTTAGTESGASQNAGQNTGGSTSSTEGNVTTVSTPAVYTGSIVSSGVKIQKTADADALTIREMNVGESITIHELVKITTKRTVETGTTVDGNATTETTTYVTETTYWARVNDGWIMNPEQALSLNALDEIVYTVTGESGVNVRTDANGSIVTSIAKGTQVAVTNLKIDDDKVWGFIEDIGTSGGWVRLDLVSEGAIAVTSGTTNNSTTTTTTTTTDNTTSNISLGNGSSTGGFVTNTSGYRYTGKVIRTNTLNVRATPSTSAAKTVTLTNGQAMVIYETTIAENMAWGRCDAGWVYLYYVDLTPVTGAVDARVVYNENTIIYTDMNCSAVAGTYARMSTIDIYEIVGKMARTELGWVNTDNLL